MSRELVLAAGLVFGGLGYLCLAWYVWRYRGSAGGPGLLAILLGVFIWSTAYALELSCRTVDAAEVWNIVKYVGINLMPPALLAFGLEYTGRRGLSRRAMAALCVLPVLTVISLMIPDTRDLIHFYTSEQRAAVRLPGPPIPVNGPLFWPYAIYDYGLAFIALAMTVYRLARLGQVYRRQAGTVLVTALLPLLGSIAYNMGLFGPRAMDPMPFLFTVLAVVLVWGFFRLRLLDLMPVARDVVLEQMTDGVLVLDLYDRVVDSNPAAAALLGVRPAELVGRYLGDLVPSLHPLLGNRTLESAPGGRLSRLLSGPELPDPRAAEGAEPDDRLPGVHALDVHTPDVHALGVHALDVEGPDVEGTLQRDVRLPEVLRGGQRDVAATVTMLVSRGGPAGRLVMLHDVTERQAAQRRLHDLLAEQTRVADTLQAGLRPVSLPAVEGLQMAVRSLPSDAGGQVSGDFYDVHRVLGGDWAFVLGDVSGKGVEAAVLTSMARYTVRTLSAEGRAPGQVLEQLNRALLGDDSSERFCTVVYGRIDGADLLKNAALLQSAGPAGHRPEGFADLGLPPITSGSASVTLTLTLGGHPRPLLRRRSGEVCWVGAPGTALGLVPMVDLHETSVQLESGDVLMAYTDGVTEARRGGEQFGDERLAAVLASAAIGLRGRTGVTAAHLVAEAVAERVITAVTDWASRRDDVAVLVLAVA
jgi:serine phosphatase RsbU (regulator of sigma subunit)